MPDPAPVDDVREVSSRLLLQFHLARLERERARISGVLHDQVGQLLTATGLEIDLLKLDFPNQPELALRLDHLQEILEEAFQTVRGLSWEFHPNPVKRLGLGNALQNLGSHAESQFRGEFETLVETPELPPDVSEPLFAIASLAVDNVLRHSKAAHARLFLRDGNLEISDNGVGFDPDAPAVGMGILLMRQFATKTLMPLSLTSAPGCGTIVQTCIVR